MKKLRKMIKEFAVIQAILIILCLSFIIEFLYDLIFQGVEIVDIFYLIIGYIGAAMAAVIISYLIWKKKRKP